MSKYKSIVVILSIILIAMFSKKETYATINDTNRNFKSITIEDGLSQSSALTIMQDSKGYMWIGTADGLNRYNGKEFKVYKYNSDSENSISGNSIIDIKEDYQGNIWVGTTAGLNKISTSTNEITKYLPNKNGCNISHYRIRAIMISKSGDILVGTDDGLNKYDEKNDNFIRIYNSKDENYSLSSEEVYSMAEDLNGDYWIGTKNGLNKINSETGVVEKYFADENDETSISHNFIYSLEADKLGNLWIGTYYGGLNKLNLKTGVIEKFEHGYGSGLPGDLIKDILIDSRGYIWVGTELGFAKLNDKNNSFSTYNSSKYNSGSIVDNDILSLYEDRTGTIWIGTSQGISLFNPENLFNYYKSDPFNSNSLSSDNISGVYEDDDGILWMGTVHNGLNIFDRKSNRVIRIDDKVDYPGEPIVSNNLIREITGIDNEIWIATEFGLNKYNKDTEEITIYGNNEMFKAEGIKTLFIDSDGMLWIGKRDGLCTFDRKQTFTDYSKLLNDVGIQELDFNDIYEDNEGLIWLAVGGQVGLISINKLTNEIKTYKANNSENISHRLALSIASDDKGNLWIGTDSGLIKFNKATKEHYRYTEIDGLSNNFIYGVLFDSDENIWISTNYGISKFNIKEEKFVNYDSTDGIQGNEFNQYSYFKSKSGELFFGGTQGITSFIPKDIRDKNFKTPVEIEAITTNYGEIKIKNEIKLDYKRNQLGFEFFTPDYRDTKKVKYAYRLNGLDKDWIVSDNVQSATYSNLNPGKYEFQVAARNSSGQWSELTSISIDISSPLWKTPIAYLIYLLLGITLAYVIWNRVRLLDSLVRQRTAELNNKLKENEELYSKLLTHEKYKNNYFVNLSHELRTPLNVISTTQNLIESLTNQDKIIEKNKMIYYMHTIERNCRRLATLIDNILHVSKIEAGDYKLHIKEQDIVYLVEEAALSMRELSEEKGIELIVDPFVEEKTIECDEVEIERVIVNLISNAIKFTNAGGTIEVGIWDLKDYVKISVKDNGIGIDHKEHQNIFDRFSREYSTTSEEYGGSGLGLTLNKYLIELHDGEIWVESEIGKGSEFIIILPAKV